MATTYQLLLLERSVIYSNSRIGGLDLLENWKTFGGLLSGAAEKNPIVWRLWGHVVWEGGVAHSVSPSVQVGELLQVEDGTYLHKSLDVACVAVLKNAAG